MRLTRRAFVASAAATTATHALRAQTITAHTSVAELERTHILATAKHVMASPQHSVNDPAFVRVVSASFASLIAAFVLTKDETYSKRAGDNLQRFLDVQTTPFSEPLKNRDDIVKLVPLAELARAASFLEEFATEEEISGIYRNLHEALAMLLRHLNEDPQAQLARDTKGHRASAWLLITAACARATRNETELDKLRLRFKKPTLRNQISLEGKFPQELATDNPLCNTLFNFDLLAGACQLLTSPFDDLWHFELPEGTGMRSCAAYLYPFLNAPAHWPAIADAQDFREVPLRRPGLLFAGRAYSRDEYVQLFASLPTPNPPAEIAYSLPITQPILWTTRTPHGL